MPFTHRTLRAMRSGVWILSAVGATWLTGAGTVATAHAQPVERGRLVLSVLDATGARIPQPVVRLERMDAGPRGAQVTVVENQSDQITIDLPPGRYRLRMAAPGFRELTLIRTIRSQRTTRLSVRLALAHVEETVVVSRDRQTAALDSRGFSTFLSPEQIEALPDDPEELVRVLRAMAPPGAVIRIDGFAGGAMPSKVQILSIRIPRLDVLPAQEHGGLTGGVAIDIVTRPGGGAVTGTADATGRHGTLAARSPLASSKPDGGMAAAGLTLDGPVVRDTASFSLSSRLVTRSETATLQAILPGGITERKAIEQPATTWLTAGRFATLLPSGHTLRAALSHERRSSANLGVGDYNLEERAFDAEAFDTMVRVATGGAWGRRRYVESRVQLRWSGSRNVSALEAPTLQVLGAFTSGGAQATGGSRAFEVQAASDVDYATGPHAWRTGVLVDTGAYRSNRRSNYLGTYTFTSLADYDDGRPAFYTVRAGDARIRYRDVQAAAYLQDDYRASRSLMLSYGLRGEWQSLLHTGFELLPRAALTWSPAAGTPVLRVSWGRFRDWFPAAVHERTQLLDGKRQVDARVASPSFPSIAPGDGDIRRERLMLNDDVQPSIARRLSVGIEHQLNSQLRLSASYAMTRGDHLLRGQNLNPVVDGVRGDEHWGNVIESVSDAASRTHTFTIQTLLAPRSRRFDGAISYLFSRARTNSAGAFAVPSQNGGVAGEWGPADPSHTVAASATMRAGALVLTLTPRWRTGAPYTITTLESDDGLYTTRPPGVSRNSETTPAQCDVGLRIAYTVRLGRSGISRATTIGGPADGDDVIQAQPSIHAPGRRRLELFAAIQNLTNHPNYMVIGSVAGSPLFGQPLAAGTPRRIDMGARVSF